MVVDEHMETLRVMDPVIIANHRIASESAVRFLRYSVAEGHCLKKLDLLDDSLPGFLRHYPYPLHSWPWFIAQDLRDTLAQSVARIPELIYRAVRLEFGRDRRRFAAFYDISEVLAEIFLDSGMDMSQLMLRIDAMMTASGLKIMELNAGPDIGGWQIHWMDALYRKNEALKAFFATNACASRNIPLQYMKYLVRMARNHHPDGVANVAIVAGKRHAISELDITFQGVFRAALQECDADGELFFESNLARMEFEPDTVRLDGKVLGAIATYRFGTDITPPIDLYRAFFRGRIYWPDNPFVSIIGDKRSLAIVNGHKHSDIFTDEERRLIEAFVPWGAMPGSKEVELGRTGLSLEVLLKRQHDLVIKAARGAQGNDVFVGRYQSAESWRDMAARALSEPMWLVQEYCDSLPFYGQAGEEGYSIHDVIWGVFGFGGEYGGCWLRLSRKGEGDGVINSAKGAQEAIVYEVVE